MNLIYLFLVMLFSFSSGLKFEEGQLLDTGKQPEISSGSNGTVQLVYGRSDSIFYRAITIKDNVSSLPVFIAQVPGMHLGGTRGPQFASSATVSMIAAMDKKGSIH